MVRPESELYQAHYNVSTNEEAKQVRKMRRKTNILDPVGRGEDLSAITKLAIPYTAPNVPNIPSYSYIRAAMHDKTNRIDLEGALRPVCRIGNFIIKADYCPSLVQEAEDLLWLTENTKIRVPKLYSVFSEHNPEGSTAWAKPWYSDKTIYDLVTECIEGFTMDWAKWLTLNATQQEAIHTRVSEQFALLRAVPASGYYGRINHQPWFCRLSPAETDGREPCGPYESYDELLEAMYTSAEYKAFKMSCVGVPDPDNWTPSQLAALTKFKAAFSGLRGHEPVLTHRDPSMANWIVRPLDAADLQTATDYEVTFIDWNFMGWYPAWYQRFAVAATTGFGEEWIIRSGREGVTAFDERVKQYFPEDYDGVIPLRNEMGTALMYHLNY